MNDTVVTDSINYSTEAIKYMFCLFCDKNGKSVCSIYTDCKIITIKLSLVKYLSKIL